MRHRSSVVIIACLMLALVGTMGVVVRPPGADAAIPAPADLFTRGMDGYDCFRGPRLVTTNEGTIIAIATGKYFVAGRCEDFSSSDIVARRSLDDGRTWTPVKRVRGGGISDALNASPVVDRTTGDIYLFGRRDTTPTDEDDTSSTFILVSTDDGDTWVNGPTYPTWSLRPGPSHGIQLERGPHAGRLVVAVWTSPSTGHRVRLIYKDPGETAWHLGAISDSSGEWAGEPSLFERNDGSIYVQARKNIGDGEVGEFRTYGTSTDGGATFTGPFQVVDNLRGPKVYGALLPLTSTLDGDKYNRVLFSSPVDHRPRAGSTVSDRHDMVIRSSYNEGRTWDSVSEGKLIYRGPASYSGMAEADDGSVVLAFEAGNDGQVSHEEIRVTRFTEADLGLPDTYSGGVATPDLSGMNNTARIRGGAAPGGNGRFDGGVTLDGTDDHVQVPFAESLAVDGGDFTVMAWVKYSATSGNHPIFWAYNVGDQYSQTWLRAEPGSNRIHGRIQSGDNGASVMSSRAYNDGAWHHVAFQRQGTALRLFVDGQLAGTATGPTGTVSPGRPFTMNFGRRLDGAQHFAGSLDEVRLYKKALTSTEIGRIHGTNASDVTGAVLRLPFST
jgi:sialidase-1